MKLDVVVQQDNMYDSSSSSVSSNDSASSSQESRVAHDFLATLASSYTPSGNLVSSLDGLHSGVPTRTTPTLTPTTLRSIEQTFLDFTSESGSHSREAGFVPPIIEPSQPTPAQTQNNIHLQQQQQQQPQQQQQQQQIQPQQQQQNNVLVEVQQTQLQAQQQQQPQQQQQQPQQTRRNMGGRRPTRTVGMSPEEEERRQIRRERNKMAAARCRKRRLDHTNSLLEETEGLEQKKQSLQNEIAELQHAKDELEFMLEAHRAVCRLQSSSPPDVKPVIENNKHHPAATTNHNNNFQPEEFAEIPCQNTNKQQQQQQQQCNEEQMNGLRHVNRPNTLPIFTEPKPRPSSLHIKTVETPAFMKTAAEVVGVPITTPSSGIPFNFDSLMEGGTGLTPVSTPLIPSCSSQQRNNVVVSAVDLSSPDANPPKLVSL